MKISCNRRVYHLSDQAKPLNDAGELRRFECVEEIPFDNAREFLDYRHVQEKGESKLFQDAVMEGMRLLESMELTAAEKREQLQELADSVQAALFDKHVRDVLNVGRLWGGR